jgi:hypothetical protein
MLNVPYYTQDFVKGAVLVCALALTFWNRPWPPLRPSYRGVFSCDISGLVSSAFLLGLP